jgi:plastocyanin
MPRSTRVRLAALAAVAVLGFAACGDDDDGGSVRDLDEGSGSTSGSGSASGSASGPGSGSGSASGVEGAACSPVGEELSADETVEITLDEYAFNPPRILVGAGVVTFAATNQGEEDHELAFLPGGGEVPLTADGAPDEEALAAAGAFELEAFGPGECEGTFELAAGDYTLFCIVEAPDGETHASKGMLGELTVT